MAKLIGTGPNQVPTNADLGSMAFEDKKNYATTSSPIYQPFRNIIINGDMSIAQRSTSVASITSSSYYTCDRWRTDIDTAGTWTQSQDTDVPSGQGFATSLKMDCTTANGSLSASSALQINTRFEGQNLQYLKKGTSNALSLTASFWVKSSKTGTYVAELYDDDNTRGISKSYTIDTANTWEKKTITFAGDTTGALDNDKSRSLRIIFWLAAGTDYTSGTLATSWSSITSANRAVGQVNLADSTSNDFWITGVQLEAGTTASDFEFLPYDMNLQRCQRYYSKIISGATYGTFGAGGWVNTTTANINILYPSIMRNAPSIAGSGLGLNKQGTIYATSVFPGTTYRGLDRANIQPSITSGGVAGEATLLFANNDATANIELNSEL